MASSNLEPASTPASLSRPLDIQDGIYVSGYNFEGRGTDELLKKVYEKDCLTHEEHPRRRVETRLSADAEWRSKAGDVRTPFSEGQPVKRGEGDRSEQGVLQ